MPSSGFNRAFPNNPLSRLGKVSAGATRSPRKDSRFRLNTHKVRFIVFSLVSLLLFTRDVTAKSGSGFRSDCSDQDTFLRRRWIRKANPMANKRPATMRMIVELSIIFLLSFELRRFAPFQLKNSLKPSNIMIIEGPIVTTNNDGKMNSTSGNTSLTVVLAACSSASCRRRVRSVSE